MRPLATRSRLGRAALAGAADFIVSSAGAALLVVSIGATARTVDAVASAEMPLVGAGNERVLELIADRVRALATRLHGPSLPPILAEATPTRQMLETAPSSREG